MLQKIMRREYIKAQKPSTFKEQVALMKNTPGKARGLSKGRRVICSAGSAITLSPVLQLLLDVAAALDLLSLALGDSYWVPCGVPAW